MKISSYRNKSLFFRFLILARHLEREVLLDLKKLNLSIAESLCLIALHAEEKKDEIFLTELSEIFELQKSVISYSISRLEQLGLVKRSLHPSDKRRYKFALTEKGKRTAIKSIGFFDSIDDRIERKLSDSEFNTVEKVCAYFN